MPTTLLQKPPIIIMLGSISLLLKVNITAYEAYYYGTHNTYTQGKLKIFTRFACTEETFMKYYIKSYIHLPIGFIIIMFVQNTFLVTR